MNLRNEKIKDRTIFILDGDITIYDAVSLRNTLLEALDTSPAIELNLADVTDCDITALQILVAAGKTAEKNKRRLSITDCSDSLAAKMRQIGFDMPAAMLQ